MARCPQCKEPVSQFAAGCGACGADLDAARRTQAARRRPSLRQVPRIPDDLVAAVVMTVLTLFAPFLGAVLSALIAVRSRASDQRLLRILLWSLVAIGIVLLASPTTRYGGVLALTG